MIECRTSISIWFFSRIICCIRIVSWARTSLRLLLFQFSSSCHPFLLPLQFCFYVSFEHVNWHLYRDPRLWGYIENTGCYRSLGVGTLRQWCYCKRSVSSVFNLFFNCSIVQFCNLDFGFFLWKLYSHLNSQGTPLFFGSPFGIFQPISKYAGF